MCRGRGRRLGTLLGGEASEAGKQASKRPARLEGSRRGARGGSSPSPARLEEEERGWPAEKTRPRRPWRPHRGPPNFQAGLAPDWRLGGGGVCRRARPGRADIPPPRPLWQEGSVRGRGGCCWKGGRAPLGPWPPCSRGPGGPGQARSDLTLPCLALLWRRPCKGLLWASAQLGLPKVGLPRRGRFGPIHALGAVLSLRSKARSTAAV